MGQREGQRGDWCKPTASSCKIPPHLCTLCASVAEPGVPLNNAQQHKKRRIKKQNNRLKSKTPFKQSLKGVPVPRTGIEPARLAAHAPETCASTYSATWAFRNCRCKGSEKKPTCKHFSKKIAKISILGYLFRYL